MLSLETVLLFLRRYKYLAMFGVIFLSGAGLPVPEELALIASGLAVGWEVADYWLAAAACVLGILASDSIIYGMGHRWGGRVLGSRPFLLLVPAARQARIGRLFERHGGMTVFIGRFIPLVRFGIFFYAGQRGMSYWRFIGVNFLGALISGPLTVAIGAVAARQIAEPEQAAELARRLVAEEKHWFYVGLALLVFLTVARWAFLRSRSRRRESGEAVT
jgi:membrane protein DedA with SNARE-associated domain